jgi:predicted PurR-regulated permease PerM
MDFAIIIGIVAGLFNLIPYFGPVVGFVLAGLIGLVDGNPMKAIYGVAALMIIQQIDGWIIVPKVVGGSVKLHPVVVLLSILIGGSLFGLAGMLLGVPVAAFIRLVILRYMKDTVDVEEH